MILALRSTTDVLLLLPGRLPPSGSSSCSPPVLPSPPLLRLKPLSDVATLALRSRCPPLPSRLSSGAAENLSLPSSSTTSVSRPQYLKKVSKSEKDRE
ncbi:hypothetical protein GDO78_002071 [Eleutherodactylus coqui]|uniref:Uncharacterized protein n=1 Tax=Eleutherodactylus coqui TaxID=57060 RepID=A0A8J6FVN2_ELECQ|nr:hypothetical protein GDO78_002071 [Eleutherodactylus coqui]